MSFHNGMYVGSMGRLTPKILALASHSRQTLTLTRYRKGPLHLCLSGYQGFSTPKVQFNRVKV